MAPSFTIALLHPPGPGVLRTISDPSSASNVPQLFRSALDVRITVFVDEQNCPLENEIDHDDSRSWHWVCFDGEKAVGTLRIVPVAEGEEEGKAEEDNISSAGTDGQGQRTEPYHHATKMWDGHEAYIKVGRMATLKEYRGQGVARQLIQEAMEWVEGHSGEVGRGWKGLILSHAQKEVEVWWGKMGFKSDEGLGVWYEEGIEHVGMWRRVDVG